LIFEQNRSRFKINGVLTIECSPKSIEYDGIRSECKDDQRVYILISVATVTDSYGDFGILFGWLRP